MDGAGDATYVVLTDDRGTVMSVADTAGNVVKKLFYNSTGLAKVCNTAGIELTNTYGEPVYKSRYVRLGWTGMHRDPFTGLYHTHFRDFDPLTARWTSEDPAGYADGLNLYANYFGVNGVDALGLGDRISGDFLVTGTGHHYFPVDLWEKFGFPREVKLIFDRETIRDVDMHGALGHGPLTGYTAHVTALADEVVDEYLREKNIGKKGLTKPQYEELARRIVDRIRTSKNRYIRGYLLRVRNYSRLLDWYEEEGRHIKPPDRAYLRLLRSGEAKIARKASVWRRIGPHLPLISVFFAASAFTSLEAAEVPPDTATALTVLDAVNPTFVPVAETVVKIGELGKGASRIGEGTGKEVGSPTLDPIIRARRALVVEEEETP
ncbi:MAG: hypothetical protein A3K19_20635 [Lentisphaerae bacterium RIFOXYB12_FULL_65_16]|nr:MAG: hypothetical protein A3K19_20635 [Lentisphaerae bacterium RIFOXYB12_FULL_65_16]